jgi:hypothetical protein
MSERPARVKRRERRKDPHFVGARATWKRRPKPAIALSARSRPSPDRLERTVTLTVSSPGHGIVWANPALPSESMSRFPVLVLLVMLGLGANTRHASAQDGRTFVIPDDGGYGISGCFASGAACGRMVADSWCSAQGRGAATSFGLAADITASIPGETARKPEPTDIVITCGN